MGSSCKYRGTQEQSAQIPLTGHLPRKIGPWLGSARRRGLQVSRLPKLPRVPKDPRATSRHIPFSETTAWVEKLSSVIGASPSRGPEFGWQPKIRRGSGPLIKIYFAKSEGRGTAGASEVLPAGVVRVIMGDISLARVDKLGNEGVLDLAACPERFA